MTDYDSIKAIEIQIEVNNEEYTYINVIIEFKDEFKDNLKFPAMAFPHRINKDILLRGFQDLGNLISGVLNNHFNPPKDFPKEL